LVKLYLLIFIFLRPENCECLPKLEASFRTLG